MKVLFSTDTDQRSKNIADRYYEKYGETLEYKNVFYFKALLEEVKRNKTYNIIVINEDIEQYKTKDIEQIDRKLFAYVDSITDEAQDADIVYICSDRRTKDDNFIVRLYSIGIYNILLGDDRNINFLCDILKKPKTKREAKEYLNIDSGAINETGIMRDDEVDETQMMNILNYYDRYKNNPEQYVEIFDKISTQYSRAQLKVIASWLPKNVQEVIYNEPKYKFLLTFNGQQATNAGNQRQIDIPTAKKVERKHSQNFFGVFKKNKDKLMQNIGGTNKSNQINNNIQTVSEDENVTNLNDIAQIEENINNNQLELEELARREAEIREQQELIEKAKKEAEAREQQELAEKARKEAEAKEQQELAERAKREAEAREQQQRLESTTQNVNNDTDIIIDESINNVVNMNEQPKNAESTIQISDDDFDIIIDENVQKVVNVDEQQKLAEQAKREAEAREQQELAERARKEAEAREQQELAEKARKEAEAREQQELAEKARKEAEAREQQELAEKARKEAEAREQQELAEKARKEAEAREQQELAEKARKEAEAREQQELAEKARKEAEAREQQELAEKARKEAEAREQQEEIKSQSTNVINASIVTQNNLSDEQRRFEEEQKRLALEQEKIRRVQAELEEEKRKLREEQAKFANEKNQVGFGSNVPQNTNNEVTYETAPMPVFNYKKVVVFVGANKAGTTFMVNAIAQQLSTKKVLTSILDMTKDKSMYYIYNQDDKYLRNIATECMQKLSDGEDTYLPINKYLKVYTAIPGAVADVRRSYKHKTIIETAKNNANVTIIDADFTTPIDYFEQASEIYIIQDMDLLKMQETTSFLREIKNRNMDMSKIKVIINKYVKCYLTPGKIIDVLSYYKAPEMNFTDKLLNNKVPHFVVPYNLNNYVKYIDALCKGKMNFKSYTPDFMDAINQISNQVYMQQVGGNKKSKGGLFG